MRQTGDAAGAGGMGPLTTADSVPVTRGVVPLWAAVSSSREAGRAQRTHPPGPRRVPRPGTGCAFAHTAAWPGPVRGLIRGGWVVGFGGRTHTLIRDGVVVWEDGRIVHVGPRFDGTADLVIDAPGKLVAPGFIDTHVHSGHRASHRLIADTGRPDYFGQPSRHQRAARRYASRRRSAVPPARRAWRQSGTRLHATFTVAELLRNGVTTFMEFGSQRRVQEALLPEVERLGIRAYLGAGYDSGRWVGGKGGRLKRVVDEAAGRREFDAALDFVKSVDGSAGGRVRGLLAPREVETCSLDLLRATRRAADELRMPIVTHAAYSVIEFYEILVEHGRQGQARRLHAGRDGAVDHHHPARHSGRRAVQAGGLHPGRRLCLRLRRGPRQARRAVEDAGRARRRRAKEPGQADLRHGILFPLILLFCVIGVYSEAGNVWDIAMMLVFAVLGYLMKKFGYEPRPSCWPSCSGGWPRSRFASPCSCRAAASRSC